jgi:16S rRNA (cytosine1402-N4)-methyltransferase
MVEETARFLIDNCDGVYLDLTCGGGGHLKYISGLLSPKAFLIGIDQDQEAVAFARENLGSLPQQIQIVNSRFSRFMEVLQEVGKSKIDGALFDLGLSSHQIDQSGRGFSFSKDGPLDMRMDTNRNLTAEEILNNYSAEKLTVIFKKYGEERKARRIAIAIIKVRELTPFKTTAQLRNILVEFFPSNRVNSSLARIFQALRIEVNQELKELSETLPKVTQCLVSGGRMVAISYHSLEDRIVKQFLINKTRGHGFPEKFPVRESEIKPELEILTRKVVRPSSEEIENNSRARSARLRAARKI